MEAWNCVVLFRSPQHALNPDALSLKAVKAARHRSQLMNRWRDVGWSDRRTCSDIFHLGVEIQWLVPSANHATNRCKDDPHRSYQNNGINDY